MELLTHPDQVLTACDIWRKHKVFTPENQTTGVGDLGVLVEIEPNVKIWSHLASEKHD
jgi:hypothetical protein